jgi:hypothetical protein
MLSFLRSKSIRGQVLNISPEKLDLEEHGDVFFCACPYKEMTAGPDLRGTLRPPVIGHAEKKTSSCLIRHISGG